ncbi:hypothetical protein BTJ39_09505 [Izhakiella australiensis]|uniref:Thiol:disulfide interchange protein n=1 Tax=Izhakiella australiensis TaxID=1926881 RepID=A0A1S8YM82_9GAMM|nr:hypothetical protein BTJ39_09505 [Izhakiella australiensis]
MNVKKIKTIVAVVFCLCFSGYAGASTRAYTPLATPVADAPDVVEFFSFYCGPCFQFVEHYPVVEKINQTLPQGQTVTQYHISAMGKLGNELSEAWAVASVMGVADRVEKPLFIAVQHDRSLHNTDDIKAVFQQAGVSPEQYDGARHSLLVRAFIARQQALAEAFRVTATPSVYVKGRYLINNAAIKADTPDQYVGAFADLVNTLRKNDQG